MMYKFLQLPRICQLQLDITYVFINILFIFLFEGLASSVNWNPKVTGGWLRIMNSNRTFTSILDVEKIWDHDLFCLKLRGFRWNGRSFICIMQLKNSLFVISFEKINSKVYKIFFRGRPRVRSWNRWWIHDLASLFCKVLSLPLCYCSYQKDYFPILR